MTTKRDNAVEIKFKVPGLDQDWRVISLHGEEWVSRLHRFELLLGAPSSTVSLDKVIGKSGLVTVQSVGGSRFFHGIVNRLEQRESGRKFTVYAATLVPEAWRLTRRVDCRIFQKQGAHKIIKSVLDAAKIKHTFQHRGNQSPLEREYCVQYRETDWDFISRLLEEEGYYYYFEHSKDQHLLRISNNSTVAADVAGGGDLRFVGPASEMPGDEHLFMLNLRQELCSGMVSLTDYNFENPSASLMVQSAASRDMNLELYDYPGLYDAQAKGKTVSQVRLEEVQARAVIMEGQSTAPRFNCGLCFSLDGHDRPDLNKKKFLLTRVSHHADKSATDLESGALDDRCTYHNTFTCIPRQTPLHPPRTTPMPVVLGAQTALVVGPSTEEIHTDKHGRVKVQFHWDRLGQGNQHSSCWVRVSQLWAGQGWGAMFIPRIGQEVIVDFLEGNPDRPIITGRVYHAQNPPPYTLPGAKTRSTIMSNSTPGGDGSNEIRFEDQKGREEIFVHAEHDQNEEVEHDLTTNVGNDLNQTVNRNRHKTVVADETNKIGQNRTESVGKNESISITGNRTESVSGNEAVTVSGTRTHTVGSNQKVTVKKDATLAVIKNETEKVGLKKRLTIGSSYSTTVGGRMDLTVGGELVSKIETALSEQVGTTKTVRIGTKLEIICGSSRLIMEKSGRITLEGKEFVFNANGPVGIKGKSMRMQGTSLEVKTSGPIKLKGSKISKN